MNGHPSIKVFVNRKYWYQPTPWNQSRYKFSYQDGGFYVTNKVVAFHFSNLIQIEKGVWIVNMNKIPIRIDTVLKRSL